MSTAPLAKRGAFVYNRIMILIFDRETRRDFEGLLKWWFSCAALLGVAMPLLAAAAIWLTAFFVGGASASELAWSFLSDVRDPMVASVAGLHLFGALATFIAYGFAVEMSALLFSGGGSFLAALIAVGVLIVGLASRAAVFLAALGDESARRAAFTRRFPAFFFLPGRTGLLRASNPAGAAPRRE